MEKFDLLTIERNQKMIREWAEEARNYSECAVIMFTFDHEQKLRMFVNQGVSERLLRYTLESALESIGK